MKLGALMVVMRRFLGVRSGDGGRVGSMAALLFFLLAANNIIKVVRDSLFLSHFPISELPYVYLLTALIASVVIGIYSHYTAKLSIAQVLRGTHAFIIVNLAIFWMLVTLYHSDAVLYAFYIWSGIAGLVVVAQFWTLANDMFTPRDGKRLFGVLTAGGTLGGLAGGIGAKWAVKYLFATSHLLWLVAAIFVGAFGAGWFAARERQKAIAARLSDEALSTVTVNQAPDGTGVVETIRRSRHLQLIATLIFISIVVSTLIDYRFKAAAKAAYPSMDLLAGFFGSYYAWLSVVTVFMQLWLTGKSLMGLGLTPTLLLLPVTLLAGTFGSLIWPGLWLATGTRLSEASLRTSVNHSSLQILYLPIPESVKRKVKVLLDVTVERLGDGTAALCILLVAFAAGSAEAAVLKYLSAGLILMWIAVVLIIQRSYTDALRQGLARREASLELARIDFADRGTVEAVLKTLDERDDRAVIFGLDLAAKLDPGIALAYMPRSLLRHPSPMVRSRAVKLLAAQPEAASVEEVTQMLRDEDKEVQAAAVSAAGSLLKDGALPVLLPHLEESQDPQVRRRVLECLLLYGDAASREIALSHFVRMVNDTTPQGEPGRVEAARLIGEVDDSAFPRHLERLISEDRSFAVIRAAMAAAARGRYERVIPHIIGRLGSTVTKTQAREALVQFGETAVPPLRETLFDADAGREVRINIPRTLSKVPAQSAMHALLSALGLEDRSIRYKVIMALEEMARRFGNLRVDRGPIERAIVSDAMLYFRRFVIFCVLFGAQDESSGDAGSLLRLALTESMERVKERVMWLLSLVYPSRDIRSVWSTLSSKESGQRDYAIEFLDNLLAGNIKQYVFPLFSDAPQAQRYKTALAFLGMEAIDKETALSLLLQQDDIWLTAATVWEIGIRRLGAFREAILTFANSKNPMLRETATLVGERLTVQ